MTNREWTDLIAKEFKVSNTVAKKMLHAMYNAKPTKPDTNKCDNCLDCGIKCSWCEHNK